MAKIRNRYSGLVWSFAIMLSMLSIMSPKPALAMQSPLRITEIMYDPSGDGTKEFIEFYNGSDTSISLAGYSTFGVDYVFPNISLSANSYIVITRNISAFSAVYPSARVAGQYSGKLRGSGETIRLYDNTGATLSEVSYSYVAPWPTSPKNGGPSLSLLRPTANESTAGCWAASSNNGGTPASPNNAAGSGCGDKSYPVTASAPTPAVTSPGGSAPAAAPSAAQNTAVTDKKAAPGAKTTANAADTKTATTTNTSQSGVATVASDATTNTILTTQAKQRNVALTILGVVMAVGSIAIVVHHVTFKKSLALVLSKSKATKHVTKKA